MLPDIKKIITASSVCCCFMLGSVTQAGPRDAPAAALDPAADITDLYFFRSWEDPDKLVFIVNVLPGQTPGDGPVYFHFDDEVRYRINIDNDMNGRAGDIVYEFSFKTEHRSPDGGLTFPLPYVGNPAIQSRPELRGIAALDGPGSEGITLRQSYTVTEIKHRYKHRELFDGRNLIAVPSNVGPVTMPEYEMLAAQGVYRDDRRDIRVFAGQRADVFYADTGALFDGAAPRRVPPVLTPEEDASNTVNPFGVNNYRGRNVHSIVLEVPIERITGDRLGAEETQTPFIGVYASASRSKHTDDHGNKHRFHWFGGRFWTKQQHEQVSRMGNPMVRSLIIDTPNKDRYNRSSPRHDMKFADLYSDPPLARPPTSEIFGIPVPPPPREDLVSMFLKYPGQSPQGSRCGYPCADLLRLNVSVPPTEPESQQRMGSVMGTDPAGLPNGRRPGDDAVDFVVRAIGGPALIAGRISDGVNYADGIPGAGISDGPGYGTVQGNRLDVLENGIVAEFPFMPTPHSGR